MIYHNNYYGINNNPAFFEEGSLPLRKRFTKFACNIDMVSLSNLVEIGYIRVSYGLEHKLRKSIPFDKVVSRRKYILDKYTTRRKWR